MATALELMMRINAVYSGDSQFVKASSAIQKLQSRTQKLQAVTGKIASLQSMNSALEQSRQKMLKASERAQALGQKVSYSDKVTDEMRAQLSRANQEQAKSIELYNRKKQAVEELSRSLQASGVNVNNLASEEERLASITARLVNAQDKYQGLREKVTWDYAKRAVVQPALPVVQTLRPMVRLAADFESAMARVKAVGFTNADADMTLFEKMAEQARQLGADTQFTAIQAAGAQENLIRAGMTPQQVMAALPSVLNMASAEGMSIEQAASIIAKGLGGMNLSAELSPRLADILAYTSANTNTSIAQLGEAFKVAAPVASSQNITMEDLSTFLGILANKGFEGSEAGNAVAKSIQRLAKRPKEANDALNELGVATRSRDGRMRPLLETLSDLGSKLSKFGENKQLEYLSNIFGAHYGSQMMGLMQATMQGESGRLQGGIYNESYGRAANMTNINLDTLNGQITILGSAWDGLRTKIGDIFSPAIRQGVELLTQALSGLTQIMKDFPNASALVTWGLSGLAGIKAAKGIWDIGSALVRLPGAYLETMRASRAAGEALGGVNLITKAGTGLQWLWNAALNANPIVLVTAGVMGLIAAIELLYHNWDTVKALGTAAAQKCMELWNEFVSWFNSIDFSGIWEGLKASATSAIEWLKAPFVAFGNWLKDKFASLNPFNWELPSWLGGGKASGAQQAKNATTALGGYQPPEIHAYGGIMTRPHVGLVAEAGPEAIVPLSNKTRGLEVLTQAAGSLGATIIPHADGGIMTRPHVGLVAEAGPEAIVPLSNKTRGLEVLTQAAGSLGARVIPEGIRRSGSNSWGQTRELIRDVNATQPLRVDGINPEFRERRSNSNSVMDVPAVNLTVNVNGDMNDPQGLASRISEAVREVLRGLMSDRERLSYA